MVFVDRPLPASLEIKPIASRRRNPVNPPGKPKGTLNKFTRDIKAAVLQAAANVGDEDYGGRGLVGYCEDLARHHKRAFAALLGKMMPLAITGDGATSAHIGTVNVLSVPVDHYLSAEDIARLRNPSQFEHAPQPVPVAPAAIAAQETEPRSPEVPSSSEEEERIIADLKDQINELAQKMGVPLVV